jgi:hypothetical protein
MNASSPDPHIVLANYANAAQAAGEDLERLHVELIEVLREARERQFATTLIGRLVITLRNASDRVGMHAGSLLAVAGRAREASKELAQPKR